MLLRAEQVTKSYATAKDGPVLKPTSLQVEQGTIHVIQGKSGSGKSTLLSLLGGMERPTAGSIYIESKSLYDLSDTQQARVRGEHFGFVFQSFHLVPELTVQENIVLPLRFTGQTIRIDKVRALAGELGIESKLAMRPAFLSGGEQQRVAIARAMIAEPKIIFADEPTGNLDQKTSKDVVKALTKLCMDYEQALIMVTHEQGLIQNPDHTYWMEDGVLKEVAQ